MIKQHIDWKLLKTKLQYERWQPMYNSEIHIYLKSLLKEPYPDWNDLTQKYLESFHLWIKSSRLNDLKGLDTFPYKDFCIGVTHSLDDLHIRYRDSLVALKKEYKYHWRIRPDMKTKTIEELSKGDVLVLSLPFAHTGSVHRDMDDILKICLEKNIPLHIDSAWFGACRDIQFDYAHPAVQSVSFSLSKGLGLGQYRSGIRYSRERAIGPVTVINDFNYYVPSSAWIGLKFMQNFSPDYMQNKYYTYYNKICNKLNLKPSPTIFVAYEKNCQNEYHPVGIRPLLRWLSEQKY